MEAGGTELNAVRLAERLNRDRFDIRVVCMRKEGPLAARYEAAGVPVESFPLRSLYGPSAVRQGLRLARYLRTQRIAIVHAHDIYSNVFDVPWARLAGARTIASRRWWEGFQAAPWRLASRLSYRAAHAVLANSTAIGRLLVDAEGVPSSRVVVVSQLPGRGGVRASRRNDGNNARSGAPVGGWRARRGNRCQSPSGEGSRRAAAGGGDPAPLLAPAPRRAGWRRSMPAGAGAARGANSAWKRRSCSPDAAPTFPTFTSCSISRCSARRSEGLPNSILEAMAAARPVVATKVGAVADAVIDGETGILVPPADHVQMAAAIRPVVGRSVPRRTIRPGGQRLAPGRTIRRRRRSTPSRVCTSDSPLARSVATVAPAAPAGRPRGAAGESADSVRRPTASRVS